ncbi:MAG TPA: DUF4132 domain-containing protein [Acidimicrobiales bacterium]|nr:DUF4132 domain-containing protein [Acidimicrobiales bacterium]
MTKAESADLNWIDTPEGYSLAIDGTRLVCRNAKGKRLASVPAALKDSEVAIQLRALRDWLASHDASCLGTVERWMLRSLPTPLTAIAPLWADPSWRRALEDTVVAPIGKSGDLDWHRAGLLREVDDRGAGAVTLDGETTRLAVQELAIPHPVLFEDLGEWRDFASDLNVQQGIPQLFRETFNKEAEVDLEAASLSDFADAQFQELRHALGRCRTVGVVVSGGYAVTKVWERGALVEARYWIGADAPEAPTWTGDVVWVDANSRQIKLGDVGPVAWSEGFRMATLIYAARKVDDEEDAA